MDSDQVKAIIGQSAMRSMDEWDDGMIEDFETLYVAVRVFARRQADREMPRHRIVAQIASLGVVASLAELEDYA